MGEATYYLKAQWKNRQAAHAALPKVKTFIEEVGKAYNFWQANRDSHMRDDAFRADFQGQFPQAYDFLKFQKLADGDKLNDLAGNISFGDEDQINEENPQVDGTCIKYRELTWHFANWGPFCEYLKLKFGAEKAGYVSDEDVEPDFYSMVELS